MKEMFSADDLTLVNLEGVLSDRGWGEDKSKTFRFRGPADYARILKESGIEACAVNGAGHPLLRKPGLFYSGKGRNQDCLFCTGQYVFYPLQGFCEEHHREAAD